MLPVVVAPPLLGVEEAIPETSLDTLDASVILASTVTSVEPQPKIPVAPTVLVLRETAPPSRSILLSGEVFPSIVYTVVPFTPTTTPVCDFL